VLWAKADHERILCRHNFPAACGEFAKLAAAGGKGPAFMRLGRAIIEEYPGSRPLAGGLSSIVRDPAGHPFHIILSAIARAGSEDLLECFLEAAGTGSFELCDSKLWRKLIRVFGVGAFDNLCKILVEEGVDNNRRALFQYLDAIHGSKAGGTRAEDIASRLAGLSPALNQPSIVRLHAGTPDSREEARVLLCASHHLKNDVARTAATAFLEADGSVAYIRNTLRFLSSPPRANRWSFQTRLHPRCSNLQRRSSRQR